MPDKKIVPAIFVSNWEEGSVESPCDVELDTLKIVNIVASDEGEDFEHLINEEVQIPNGGKLRANQPTVYVAFALSFNEDENAYFVDESCAEEFRKTLTNQL